jgi:hypothetical protein
LGAAPGGLFDSDLTNFASVLWNKSQLSDMFKNTQPKTDQDHEIKCYESMTQIEWILDGSRYWVEGIVLSVIGFTGIFGRFIFGSMVYTNGSVLFRPTL